MGTKRGKKQPRKKAKRKTRTPSLKPAKFPSSSLEDIFWDWWETQDTWPLPEREYRGIPDTRYRFDFAWPHVMLAVEIEGGTWLGKRGAHTSAKGYHKDCNKYNLAAVAGWTVLRYTTTHIKKELEETTRQVVDELRRRMV